MTILKQMQRFNTVNKLIISEKTGNPEDFAEQLGVCRSHLFNIIEQFKDYGAPIRYNKKNETYYYATSFNLELKYCLKTVAETETEEKKAFAGFCQNPLLLDGSLFSLQHQKQSRYEFGLDKRKSV